MPSAATSSFEPATGRTLRSVGFVCALAMAALVYLLLALPGIHHNHCSSGCHDALETVHLPPRGTSDLDVTHPVLMVRAVLAVVEAAPPLTGSTALIALVTVLVAALLAFFPVTVARIYHPTVEAVLGIGRWHRTVVLHL